jgi:hypothetical protein
MSTNAQFASNAACARTDSVPPSSGRNSTIVSKQVGERHACETLRVPSNEAIRDVAGGGRVCAELRVVLEEAEWEVVPSSCLPTTHPSATSTMPVPYSSSEPLRLAPTPQTGIAALLREFVLEHVEA